MNSMNIRLALLLDAIASGATGLLLVGGSALLPPFLGLPAPLMLWAGVILLPFALFVAWASRSQSSAAAWPIIAINLIWVGGSVLVLGWLEPAPSFLGYAFVSAQAIVVLAFAILQWLALRNLASNSAAA